MIDYDPRDWYWNVNGQIWSSRHGYISNDHPDYLAFLATGTKPTNINSAQDLDEVILNQYPEIHGTIEIL